MIILRQSRFLHVPKTGGTWIDVVLRASGLAILRHADSAHMDARSAPGDGLYTFCGIRDPVSWHEAYWRYKMTRGWRVTTKLDLLVAADTHERFLTNVLEKVPDYYTRLLMRFMGRDGSLVDMILRQSHLEEDLIRTLHAAGETFDEDKIRGAPPVNVSEWPREKVSPELIERIRQENQLAYKLLDVAAEMQARASE